MNPIENKSSQETSTRISVSSDTSYGRFKLVKNNISANSSRTSAISLTKPLDNYEETTFIIPLDSDIWFSFFEFSVPFYILLLLNILIEYKSFDFGTKLGIIALLLLSELAFCSITSKYRAK